ncbi:DUF2887 domain-containing protein [Aerosakkonema funiforme]|uniref:DUF2887 domain-containing protein n=1 Tax=Aerosakkonema funiforme TaxID=1246630 RepID=UPI0035B8B768
MKTDTIFYQLFKEFPNIFFELIGQPDANVNAFIRTYAEHLNVVSIHELTLLNIVFFETGCVSPNYLQLTSQICSD